MKTMKIMGAVLVALLAAALFVGAGAAADSLGTVFVYQNNSGFADSTWNYGSNTITFDGNGVLTGDNIVEGKYTNGSYDVYVKYPTGTVSAILMSSGTDIASIIGGSIANGQDVKFNLSVPAKNIATGMVGLIFTSPKGVRSTIFNGTNFATSLAQTVSNLKVDAGTWKVQAYFATGVNGLVPITPLKYRIGKEEFTFTVSDVTNKIESSADTVLKGNAFTVTVYGEAGKDYTLAIDDYAQIVPGQPNVAILAGSNNRAATVTIGGDGKTNVGILATAKGKATITSTSPAGSAKKVKVTIENGVVTAEATADFYYLGTEVKLTGTNTESSTVVFYVKGSNMPFQAINTDAADVKSDKTWEKKFGKTDFANFDAGTYTIYAVSSPMSQNDITNAKVSDYTYASVSVALKQPFLTATLSSSVIAQGSDLTVSGTAESADLVKYYIFGNNKFVSENLSVDDDGTYSQDITIDRNEFATGQYFVIVQHPMYDKFFNIGPLYVNGSIHQTVPGTTTVGKKLEADIVLNTWGSYVDLNSSEDQIKNATLFNTGSRQSANAAEALCQALDTQNIDDIYVKATFIVATPTMAMNPVSDVVKGSALKVSGTTNMAPGEVVTVEILSTAFAAVPKESVNSASFITLTTKVVEGKDGVNTWEVTFDTTGLNVDEYSLSASMDGVSTSTVTVKVLEGTPTATPAPTGEPTAAPTTVPTTAQPTTTPAKTPGFGALVALAGLGAVAVLLLRRE